MMLSPLDTSQFRFGLSSPINPAVASSSIFTRLTDLSGLSFNEYFSQSTRVWTRPCPKSDRDEVAQGGNGKPIRNSEYLPLPIPPGQASFDGVPPHATTKAWLDQNERALVDESPHKVDGHPVYGCFVTGDVPSSQNTGERDRPVQVGHCVEADGTPLPSYI